MVTRIKKPNRRYGRGDSVVASTSGTHVIKIGWKGKSAHGKDIPVKLGGFLICRDDLDKDNRLIVDYEAMQRLGFDSTQVALAIEKHWNAPDGTLPKVLHFVIMHDAVRVDDGWIYPGTMAEAYQCYNKSGLFCYGDGEHATRKMTDGSKRQIPCIPAGKIGPDPEHPIPPTEYCEFSTKKECKFNYRLTVCLYYLDGIKAVPLSPELGRSALYRFDSTSELAGPEIFEELDRAADRVRGQLNQITGTLTFQRKRRRTGGDGAGAAIVGHVLFQLDEESIRAKEMMLAALDEKRANYRLEAARAGAPQLEYHPQTIVDIEPEPESEGDAPSSIIDTPEDVEVSGGDQQEDDPFGADEMKEPDLHVPSVNDADAEYLADALQTWADETGAETGQASRAVIRNLACDTDERAKKIHSQIEDATWFLSGQGAGYAGRIELLRAMCRKLDEENAPHFQIAPHIPGGGAEVAP